MAHYILNNFDFNFVKFLALGDPPKIPLAICDGSISALFFRLEKPMFFLFDVFVKICVISAICER